MDKKYRILLVDDDPDFVKATTIVLESKNYEVLTASDGIEGLETARKEIPDLILLDVIMPSRDGFTAAEKLKEDPALSKIPVVMLTSFSAARAGTSIAANRGMNLDAEDYLDKPVSPDDLLACVQQFLK
jgi:two-component system, OmpR family, alkaline phosphatase synthesis response regulator PhoP